MRALKLENGELSYENEATTRWRLEEYEDWPASVKEDFAADLELIALVLEEGCVPKSRQELAELGLLFKEGQKHD